MKNLIKIVGLIFILCFIVGIPAYSQQRVVRPTMVIDFPNGGPNFQFYNKIDENDTQSRWRYSLIWDSIIEYSDSNHNGIFDKGIDTLVRNISLSDLNFSFVKVQANLTGINNQLVTGSQLEFHGNFSVDSTLCFVNIIIGWWNDAVLHPYGSKFIKIDVSQAKYSFELDNWTFKSSNNRLAVLTEITTSTNLDSYDITKYNNGTFSMITKTDPDGKGNRGGIITNPNTTLIDENTFETSSSSVIQENNQLSMQYSFPYFNKSILYDPTYSAIAVVHKSGDQSTTKATSIQGFAFYYIFFCIPLLLIIKKKKCL